MLNAFVSRWIESFFLLIAIFQGYHLFFNFGCGSALTTDYRKLEDGKEQNQISM